MKYAIDGFSTDENGACYLCDMQNDICQKAQEVAAEIDNLYKILYKEEIESK